MKRFLTVIMLMVLLPSLMFANQSAVAERTDTIAEVYAYQISDDEVKVVWSSDKIDHRNTSEYSVYKRNVIYGTEETLIAENVTDTTFIDNTWGEAVAGVYQWGVKVVDDNREANREAILYVDFEDGTMPEGWLTTTEQSYPTPSEWSVTTSLMYTNFPADGQYSAFSNGTGIDGSLHYNMITSAINLKSVESATLSFDYANVEFVGYVCALNVKVATSQQGPWETIFTTAENQAAWTSASVSLSDYVGQTIYIAFENEDYGGYGIGVDNIMVNAEGPGIVWSNPLEKDMYTSVEVTATSNTTESLSGTIVSFVNVNEIGNDYETELDETAYYKWTDFRKGTYKYTVSKSGYNSDATEQLIEIFDEKSIECVLTEIIHAAEYLYVSPTGLATWEGEEINSRSIESYTVLLNGVEEATVTTLYYQHENLIPGETYTTTVIANYNSGDADAVDCTWTCVACDEYDGVSYLEAAYADGNAVLTWDLPRGDLKTEELYYDDGFNFNYIGQQEGGNFYWAVMFPAEEMMPGELTKVMMFDGQAHTGDIYIYLGGDTIPGTLITTQPYECTAVEEYVDFRLIEPVTIDGTENLWIVFANNDNSTQVAPASDVESVNGGWISVDGEEWYNVVDIFGFPMSWQVRGFIERGANPLGVLIYRDGEILTEEIVPEEMYHDPISSIGTYEYTLEVVYTNYAISCPQTLSFDYVDLPENNANTMNIYPNPVKDNLTISAENMTHVTITNTLGQVMLDEEVVSDNQVINMSQYKAGVYVVRIATETGVAVERITVIE